MGVVGKAFMINRDDNPVQSELVMDEMQEAHVRGTS
jgi:hypothetical protein